MRNHNTAKALTQILKIREVQKELAEIDVFAAKHEEAKCREHRDAANEELIKKQILWEEYLQKQNIIPELIRELSRDVILSDDELQHTNKQHTYAKNKSQIKLDKWKLSDVRVRQTERLKKNVKREIGKRKEEANLRITEERTSYYWRPYD